MFEYRNQPLLTLYYLYSFLTILFIRLPFWTLRSLVPSWRPRRSRGILRTILVQFSQAVVSIIFKTRIIDVINPNDADVWINAVDQDLITGQVADAARLNRVNPAKLAGYWHDQGGHHAAVGEYTGVGEKALYHLHGGGYWMATGSKKDATFPIVSGIFSHSHGIITLALTIDYRLSSAAPFEVANPFPAALIDALSGYRYLIQDMGVSPNNIIVSGDSAGGHLALSLVRYLVTENIPTLAPPRALLLSPSVDWACTHDDGSPSSSMVRNARSDFTAEIFTCGYTARALLGALHSSMLYTSPWLSPASLRIPTEGTDGLFANFSDTCIVAGGAEHSVDPMRTLRERMVKDNGEERILYYEEEDAMHDFLAVVWHEPERSRTLKVLRQWLENL